MRYSTYVLYSPVHHCVIFDFNGLITLAGILHTNFDSHPPSETMAKNRFSGTVQLSQLLYSTVYDVSPPPPSPSST